MDGADQIPCLASLDAFTGAPLRDIAAAVLWLAFAEDLAKDGPLTATGTAIDDQVMALLPETQRTGFISFAPADAPLVSQIVSEAVQVLELNALVIRRWFSERPGYGITITRRGRGALAGGTVPQAIVAPG